MTRHTLKFVVGPVGYPAGYALVICSCGWRHGPDAEYQTQQEADEHLASAGVRTEDA